MGLFDPIVFRATWSFSCLNISVAWTLLLSEALLTLREKKHGGKTALLLLESGLLKALEKSTGDFNTIFL